MNIPSRKARPHILKFNRGGRVALEARKKIQERVRYVVHNSLP